MLKTPLFKLASRILCLAVLTSGALWLTASGRTEVNFSCALTANLKTGAGDHVSCDTSEGNAYWWCENGSCYSDPSMDGIADNLCAAYAVNGCPEVTYIQ